MAALDEETQNSNQQIEGSPEPDVEQPSGLAGGLKCDNDGTKFFEVMNAVGTEAQALTADDIAGGLQSLSQNMFAQGKEDMKNGYDAAKSIDVKNGMDGFKETIAVKETHHALLIRVPVGIAYLLGASFLYIVFCVLFVTSKYGPPAAQRASVLITEKSELVNEKVIVPLKQNLRPMIQDAKARVEQAIKERTQTKSSEEAASAPGSSTGEGVEEDLENKQAEEDA